MSFQVGEYIDATEKVHEVSFCSLPTLPYVSLPFGGS